MKVVKDKSILQGDEKLINRKKWVSFDEINTSEKVLNHYIFDIAFNNIIKTFKPKNKIAFLSMCTSTRPYNASKKWSEFKLQLNNNIDNIVISNGGIIPEEFWYSYPYLNYDGIMKGKKDDQLYFEKTSKRIEKFLKKCKYDYVIVNFKPTGRFTKVALDILPKLVKQKIIKEFIIIPSLELYQDLQKRGFPRGKMFPDIDYEVLNSINNTINNFHDKS